MYLYKNVHLFVDIMYVNGLSFLMSMSKHLFYQTAIYLANEQDNTIYKALDGIFCKYNNAGYKIKHISTDNQFQAPLETIQDELKVNSAFFSCSRAHTGGRAQYRDCKGNYQEHYSISSIHISAQHNDQDACDGSDH